MFNLTADSILSQISTALAPSRPQHPLGPFPSGDSHSSHASLTSDKVSLSPSIHHLSTIASPPEFANFGSSYPSGMSPFYVQDLNGFSILDPCTNSAQTSSSGHSSPVTTAPLAFPLHDIPHGSSNTDAIDSSIQDHMDIIASMISTSTSHLPPNPPVIISPCAPPEPSATNVANEPHELPIIAAPTPVRPGNPKSLELISQTSIDSSQKAFLFNPIDVNPNWLHRKSINAKNGNNDASTPRWLVKRKVPSRSKDVKHRAMIKLVREVMNTLLGIEHDHDIVQAVLLGHFATEEDTKLALRPAYLGRMEQNLYFLKPHWKRLGDTYNVVLGQIFCDHFLTTHPAYRDMETIVYDCFQLRLRNLRATLSAHSVRSGETDKDAMARIEQQRAVTLLKKSARQRKLSGYEKRVSDVTKRAATDPFYLAVLNTIVQLGSDGYSSDERCDGYFLVHRYPWRSPSLDRIIQAARSTRPAYTRGRGVKTMPREYYKNAPISQEPPPSRLPINFYDNDWFSRLDESVRDRLNPLPQVNIPAIL